MVQIDSHVQVPGHSIFALHLGMLIVEELITSLGGCLEGGGYEPIH